MFVTRDNRANSWRFQKHIKSFQILQRDNNMIMIMVWEVLWLENNIFRLGFATKHTKKGGTKGPQDKTAHFGDFGFTEENPPTEKEKEELDNYFQKKYFKNKDYFKYKVDEDSPWNLTRKLYNQTMDQKEKAQSEHVLFNDGSHPYYASKEEMKYDKDHHLVLGLLYDYRTLIAGGFLLAGGIAVNEMLFKNDESNNKSNNKAKLMPMPAAR